MFPEQNSGAWFRPSTSFERVPLKNGPSVNNVMYSSLFGVDSELKQLKHGFDAVFTGYAGYTGSHQTYDGVSIYQNGGLIGGTAVFYKNNFFGGITANVGAMQGEASTMFGRDEINLLTAGAAIKTGYNWELFNGKFIVQPNFLISYTYLKLNFRKNKRTIHIFDTLIYFQRKCIYSFLICNFKFLYDRSFPGIRYIYLLFFLSTCISIRMFRLDQPIAFLCRMETQCQLSSATLLPLFAVSDVQIAKVAPSNGVVPSSASTFSTSTVTSYGSS